MTSSTRDSDRWSGTLPRLAVLVTVGLMFVAVHAALEGAARFSERYLGAYLWKEQDYLRLFSPANHAGRGRHRLLIYGPSEAREGLLPEEIAREAKGLKPYQNSQSIGTLEDGLIVLRYIEGAYGPDAVPDAMLLGVTTRFAGNLRTQSSPLVEGINKYSPHFRVVEDAHPPSLVRRSFVESIEPRLALLGLMPDRYRRGLFAIASRTATKIVPSLSAERRSWVPIAPSKYLIGKYASEAATKKWLVTPGNFWELVHDWNPAADRERVTRELQMYRDFAAKNGTELYVVNLPELSWNRELYKPGRYEAYLEVVRSAIGDTPFLDLRTFLPDELFFDDAHPTWDGAIKVSREVGAFINAHRRAATSARVDR
jgi:hypothetical protein